MLLFVTLLVIALIMYLYACVTWRILGQSIRRRLVASDAQKLPSAFLILLQFHHPRCTLQLFGALPDMPRPDRGLSVAAWATGLFLPPDKADDPLVQHENELSFFNFHDWAVQNR